MNIYSLMKMNIYSFMTKMNFCSVIAKMNLRIIMKMNIP